jgi:hypothetical protein
MSLKSWGQEEIDAFEAKLLAQVKVIVQEETPKVIQAVKDETPVILAGSEKLVKDIVSATEDKLISAGEAETDKVTKSVETTALDIVTKIIASVTAIPGQITGLINSVNPLSNLHL